MNFNALIELPADAQPGLQLITLSGSAAELVAGPDAKGYYVILDEKDCGEFTLARRSGIAPAPLAWLDDKPVYPGDVLWWHNDGVWEEHVADHWYDDCEAFIADENNQWVGLYSLHWSPPAKVKKEAWAVFQISPSTTGISPLPYPYATEKQARAEWPHAAAIVKVEWEV